MRPREYLPRVLLAEVLSSDAVDVAVHLGAGFESRCDVVPHRLLLVGSHFGHR